MSVIPVQILLHLGLCLRAEASCANWKIVMVSSIQGELLPALKENKLHLSEKNQVGRVSFGVQTLSRISSYDDLRQKGKNCQ
jgi:hypothetical protein